MYCPGLAKLIMALCARLRRVLDAKTHAKPDYALYSRQTGDRLACQICMTGAATHESWSDIGVISGEITIEARA